MYNEPRAFQVHNLMSFDMCIYSWHHDHPQHSECAHHPQTCSGPLVIPPPGLPCHTPPLAPGNCWHIPVAMPSFAFSGILYKRNYMVCAVFGKGVWLLPHSTIILRPTCVVVCVNSSFCCWLSSIALYRWTRVWFSTPTLVSFPVWGITNQITLSIISEQEFTSIYAVRGRVSPSLKCSYPYPENLWIVTLEGERDFCRCDGGRGP